jgi:DNA polymerase I-like protein with 3'-5' exonuclease and polymerase domains
MQAPITIDFETKPIKPRPEYPPDPVGVGVWFPGKKTRYWAWGHKHGGNNCTKGEAAKPLREAWRSGRPLLFHHANFDLDVAEEFFDLGRPPVERVLCSMIEAFLWDPNEKDLGLKELCDKHLGMPPEERDAVRDWLYQHIPGMRRKKKAWAAHIWLAPGNLVAPYCCGDLTRTRKIHDFMYPWIIEMGMAEAYLRERRLMPVALKMERRGIPIDSKRLRADVAGWEDSILTADKWVRRRLRSRDLNLDSNDDLADALERANKVDEWILTDHPTDPKRSVAMDNLAEVVKDRELYAVLKYRASLGHSLKTNARPWLVAAEKEGRIYPQWNQVRNADEGKRRVFGARTGRMQSTPNVQNISRKPMQVCFSEEEIKVLLGMDDELKTMLLPSNLKGLVLALPWMRDYITARKRYVLLDRDYAQQELRILAHFMEGEVLEMYRKDPSIDFHLMATIGLNDMLSSSYARGVVKQVVLAIIYALGIAALAEKLGIEYEESKRLKNSIKALFPGVDRLEKALRKRARLDEPFRTWGGRVYYCEPPKVIDGVFRTFEYKMINTLIQGSAADNTKEAMIRYDEVAKEGETLLQAHDELLVHTEKKAAKEEMGILRDAMESVEFDVPMWTDGKWGPTWGQLRDYKETRRAA